MMPRIAVTPKPTTLAKVIHAPSGASYSLGRTDPNQPPIAAELRLATSIDRNNHAPSSMTFEKLSTAMNVRTLAVIAIAIA